MYTGDHVAVYILLSVNKNGVTPHVIRQNKQTNNNVYHSYQGLCSLEVLWLYWILQRKISKSIRYLENKTPQEPTWSQEGMAHMAVVSTRRV